MNLAELQTFLGWSTLFNYGILLIWFFSFMFARDLLMKVHIGMFSISEQTFLTTHYAGIGLFKILVFVFNLVPWFVLNFFM